MTATTWRAATVGDTRRPVSGAGTSDGTLDADGPADGDACGRAGAGDVIAPDGDGMADDGGDGGGTPGGDGIADGSAEGDVPLADDAAGADPMAAPPPPALAPAPALPGGVEGPPPTGTAEEPGAPMPAALVEPGTRDATFGPGGWSAASAPIPATTSITRATAAEAMSAREDIPGRVLGSRRGPRSARIARSQ